MASELPPFEPHALLEPLDRAKVTYIVIGAFARVIHGAEEVTDGIDIVPSQRDENLRRLQVALDELDARRADRKKLVLDPEALRRDAVLALATEHGELKIVLEPAGTRGGYDDLRRHASREPLGKGVRPSVASVGDLARMLAALGREQDLPHLHELRQLRELERGLTWER
jgi:hypothetical protein